MLIFRANFHLFSMQGDEAFWDLEHQDETPREQMPHTNGTFDVEGPLDAKSIVRRIDRHLLPLLFSLALLCSVDRGVYICASDLLYAESSAVCI